MTLNPDDAEPIPSKLIGMYSNTELALLGELSDAVSKGIDDDDWAARQPAEAARFKAAAQRHANALNAAAPSVVGEAVQSAVKLGQDAVDEDINLAGHLAAKSGQAAGLQASVTVGEKASALALKATADGVGALAVVNQTLPSAAAGLYQQVTSRVNATPVSSDLTRRQAVQQALDVLTARGITGFRDSAGRNWSLATYVEMKSRTLVNNALMEAHIDKMLDRGQDLVVVSSHKNPAPQCQPFEGQVLSIGPNPASGKIVRPNATGGKAVTINVKASMDEARSQGFRHPNCGHSVSAFIPGASRTFKTDPDPEGYAATQRLRAMERAVRDTKRRQAVAIDPAAKKKLGGLLKQQQSALKEHAKAHALKRRALRERPDLGYRVNPPDGLPDAPIVPTPKPTPTPGPVKPTVNVDSYKATPATTKKLYKELAGLDEGGNGDLRRIIVDHPQTTHYLVARDADGIPIGATQYTPEKRFPGAPREVSIHQIRSTTKGVGAGRAMITEAARIAKALDKTGKDGYELKVFGVLESATTFYESTGAVVKAQVGVWDRAAIDRLIAEDDARKLGKVPPGLDEAAAAKKAAEQIEAERKAMQETEAWLAAESQYKSDVETWLTAENKYHGDVKKWLDAEADYTPPPVLTREVTTFDEDEGRQGGYDIWHDYADNLPSVQQKAVLDYTGNDYDAINSGLRGTAPLDSRYLDTIKLIDDAIDAAPRVPESIRVSRTVGAHVFGIDRLSTSKLTPAQQLAQATSTIGTTYTENGYMSTALQSKLDSIDTGDVELRLDVPAGTKALYVSSHDRTSKGLVHPKGLAYFGPDENELVIGRGVDYEIYDVEQFVNQSGNHDIVLHARMVSQKPKKVGE